MNFQLLEVVGRGSETQFPVAEKIKLFILAGWGLINFGVFKFHFIWYKKWLEPYLYNIYM